MPFLKPTVCSSFTQPAHSGRPAALAFAACLVAAVAGCGGGGGDDDKAGAGPAMAVASFKEDGCGTSSPDARQAELVTRINALRAQGAVCGTTSYAPAPPLVANSVLLKAADAHALDMATQNYFAHVSVDGRTPPQRLINAGYNYSNMGENLAAGQASVEAAMSDWIASPGHCQNLMNPAYRDVALSCASKPTATYRSYWVMELGRSL